MSSDKPGFLAQPVVKNVHIYRNGDPFYEGRRLVINEKRVSTFDTFLKEVTGGVQAPFGAVRNIYTPTNGHRVASLDHIQNGAQYVAAGQEKFKRLNYLQIGSRKKRTPQNNTGVVRQGPQSRVTASARFLKPIKEPCLIFVVANGDLLNPPVRLLIPQRQLGQFERVLEIVTEKMRLRVMGAVHSLYTFDGATISDGSELESGQFYVAVGREKFKKLSYSDLIFVKPASMRRHIGSKTASLPPICRDRRHNGAVGRSSTKSTAECNGTVESKVFSPGQGHKQAQPMKMTKTKSGLTMSLGAEDNGEDNGEDNDEGDPKEEENGTAGDDQSGTDVLSDETPGETENGEEETTGEDEVGKDDDVPIPETDEVEDENEGEEVIDGDDSGPAVNGEEEVNEGEDPNVESDGQADDLAPEEEGDRQEDDTDNIDNDENQEQEAGDEQQEAGSPEDTAEPDEGVSEEAGGETGAEEGAEAESEAGEAAESTAQGGDE